MSHYSNELRAKLPGLGRAADHLNSRSAAIKLFCLECQGGSRASVAECPSASCFLWPFRGKGDAERPGGVVPSLEEYGELAGDKGNAEALQAWRDGRAAEDEIEDEESILPAMEVGLWPRKG